MGLCEISGVDCFRKGLWMRPRAATTHNGEECLLYSWFASTRSECRRNFVSFAGMFFEYLKNHSVLRLWYPITTLNPIYDLEVTWLTPLFAIISSGIALILVIPLQLLSEFHTKFRSCWVKIICTRLAMDWKSQLGLVSSLVRDLKDTRRNLPVTKQLKHHKAQVAL